jgi:streptomycin 6-kinase
VCDKSLHRANILQTYLRRWQLTPDGELIATHSSILVPVRRGGEPAMLKIPTHPEERESIAVLPWWNGDGAVRVLAHDSEAILMERLSERPALDEMARHGRDDEASRIICSVVAKLHSPRNHLPPAAAIPLTRWFRDLAPAATRYGGVLRRARETADALLREPREVVVLHGDIHHGNILHSARGWVAIDPKGLIGERGFDYANTFCNPDFEVATAPGRLSHQATVIAEAAGLPRQRLLQWILAYAGLSAAWSLADGDDPDLALAVAELAAAELDRANGMM